jgi:hypothetical protein
VPQGDGGSVDTYVLVSYASVTWVLPEGHPERENVRHCVAKIRVERGPQETHDSCLVYDDLNISRVPLPMDADSRALCDQVSLAFTLCGTLAGIMGACECALVW